MSPQLMFACSIVAIKAAFPKSFGRVGNMPGTYTIRTDPSIPPAQHARCKVPIECEEQIEKTLHTWRTYKSSHQLLNLQNGSHQLHIHANQMAHYAYAWIPKIKQGNHKRTLQSTNTWGDFTQISRSNHISKLDPKDGFWSVHLDTTSSYLTTFNTHKGR